MSSGDILGQIVRRVETRCANRHSPASKAEGCAQMDGEWLAALSQLRETVGERNYATWIEPMQWTCKDGEIRVEAPSAFHRQWVGRHLLKTIEEVLRRSFPQGERMRLVLTIRSQPSTAASPSHVGDPNAATSTRVRGARSALKVGRLVEKYDFASFVVGPANQLAAAAAKTVAETPGRRFNPLFVWGGVGLGKTHLVNAIGNEVLKRPEGKRIGCLSAETFMNMMIHALRTDKMADFRERFRHLDLLLLDDVQFLAGKERTQEEFFHTFQALAEAQHQVVLTSDKPPSLLPGIEARLRSRFEGGLLVEVMPPTQEMRCEILQRKAHNRGHTLPDCVVRAIVQRCGPSVRELEGALNRVLAFVEMMGQKPTVDLVETLLGPEMAAEPVREIGIEEVQSETARYFGITVEQLVAHSRDRVSSFARQVAMYLCRSVASASLARIAAAFGGRDHTSVLYAIRTIEKRRQADADLARTLDCLANSITRGGSPNALKGQVQPSSNP